MYRHCEFLDIHHVSTTGTKGDNSAKQSCSHHLQQQVSSAAALNIVQLWALLLAELRQHPYFTGHNLAFVYVFTLKMALMKYGIPPGRKPGWEQSNICHVQTAQAHTTWDWGGATWRKWDWKSFPTAWDVTGGSWEPDSALVVIVAWYWRQWSSSDTAIASFLATHFNSVSPEWNLQVSPKYTAAQEEESYCPYWRVAHSIQSLLAIQEREILHILLGACTLQDTKDLTHRTQDSMKQGLADLLLTQLFLGGCG